MGVSSRSDGRFPCGGSPPEFTTSAQELWSSSRLSRYSAVEPLSVPDELRAPGQQPVPAQWERLRYSQLREFP